jgi:hypothetical protein
MGGRRASRIELAIGQAFLYWMTQPGRCGAGVKSGRAHAWREASHGLAYCGWSLRAG